MDGGCEFTTARDQFVRVHDALIRAVRDMGKLWREGRLQQGGLALTEVLLRDFGALIDEAQRSASIAHSLAVLQQQTLDGAPDARARLARMIEVHPAPPVCLTAALDGADVAPGDESPEFSIEPPTLIVRPAR
jgi:hypothetical protein